MSIDTDWLLDRRRLKRRLAFWRVFAVVATVAAVLASVGAAVGVVERPHIARVQIEGVIVDDDKRDEALRAIASDESVRGVIVHINSPGGTVVGGESLYRLLRVIGAEKPVVAVMGELATSAAYMTALGSDHIIAREGTLTGSIGVVLQTADMTGLLDKLGIRPETVKSSPLKAQPNPLEPFTPEAREATRRVIEDVYAMFVEMVKERRALSREQVLGVADGRIFTGRQAKANSLVDALGGEEEALHWLAEARGLPASLPVRTLHWRTPGEDISDLVGGWFGKALSLEPLSLDGLVSVWHPAL